MPRHQ